MPAAPLRQGSSGGLLKLQVGPSFARTPLTAKEARCALNPTKSSANFARRTSNLHETIRAEHRGMSRTAGWQRHPSDATSKVTKGSATSQYPSTALHESLLLRHPFTVRLA